jgi:hypothetical protein
MEIMDVSGGGGDCGTGSLPYTQVPSGQIGNNEQVTIEIDCGTLSSGKFSEDITVTYENNETGLQHDAVGEIRGRAS